MSTNYPTSFDSFTNPVASDDVSIIPHATQHANANDALNSLQIKLGIDSSADATSVDYKLRHLPAQESDFDAGNILLSATNFAATGTITVSGNLIIGKDAYFSSEYSNGTITVADYTLDWKNGQKQYVGITEVSTTVAFTNPGGACNLLVRMINDGSTATISFTGAKWSAGTQPTFSNSAGSIDIASFYFDGTNYYGVGNLDFV